MDTIHNDAKKALISTFLEYFPKHYIVGVTDYNKLFGYATSMISDLFEVETARKMFSDIYESMFINCPDKMDWFIRKIWKNNFDLKLDNSEFDRLLAAIDISRKYGFEVEYAVSKLYDTHGHIIECHYTPKNSEFKFESLLNYDQVLTMVSEYKDVALLDTCDFGIPAHKEIPVKYDLEYMSLEEICEAYLNLNGQPIIIES